MGGGLGLTWLVSGGGFVFSGGANEEEEEACVCVCVDMNGGDERERGMVRMTRPLHI